jgi:hypothetical protein
VNWTFEPKTKGAVAGEPGGNVMFACTALDEVGLAGAPQPELQDKKPNANIILESSWLSDFCELALAINSLWRPYYILRRMWVLQEFDFDQ